jgi:hypothetical protein
LISEFDLVYDQDLNLVTESCLRRWEGSSFAVNAPDKLDLRLLKKIETRDAEVVFLGWYDVAHYGHWLTEGLARYWYLQDSMNSRRKIPIAWNLRRKLKRVRDLGLRSKKVHWPQAFQSFSIAGNDKLRLPSAC